MSTIQLTPAQHAILTYAIEHTGGKVDWFPNNIQGGARKRVLEGLAKRALISTDGTDQYVTVEGYDALGIPQTMLVVPVNPEREVGVATAEASPLKAKPPKRTRENSKQVLVIAMLRRPEGVTIAQICTATGWQAHTVRGTFAGVFRRKLGLNLTSEKVANGERIYRIA